MEIRFVKQEEIDKVKWNSCVHYAINGNIFGYKWFLDFVAKDWDALVEGDYESVFPLVWKSNFWGRKMIYQPVLMRELGLFSINVLSQKRINAFLEALQQHYQKIDIVLNERMEITSANINTTPLTNYQLMLKDAYEKIYEKYSPKLKSDLDKVKNLRLTTSLKPEHIAEFYKKNSTKDTDTEFKFHALQRIMYNALHRGWGSASGVMDENENLLAVNFFLYSHGKAVSLVPVASKVGENRNALQFLFDIFIQSSAGRPIILDFNTENRWAENFGASSNLYYRLKS